MWIKFYRQWLSRQMACTAHTACVVLHTLPMEKRDNINFQARAFLCSVCDLGNSQHVIRSESLPYNFRLECLHLRVPYVVRGAGAAAAACFQIYFADYYILFSHLCLHRTRLPVRLDH